MKKLTAIMASVMLIIAMAMPVFAEGFTPSIIAKPAPEVVGGDDNIIGTVLDENGNEVSDIYDGGITITGITDKESLSAEAQAAFQGSRSRSRI